ncbi:MAG: glutamate-1-semialdehyde 2,1-aminomutase [Deltaproteobacteria bacterium]|nr:glutamate-1-semialdehyde 2,1-aminomutase [Deltaproteobacteria bacterium]
MSELNLDRSIEAMARARNAIPGGVNSPVRALKGVGGDPFFVAGGEGAFVFDLDGNRYVDLILAWGPLILGHRHPAVVEAITRVLGRGFSFGAPTLEEVELAEGVKRALPSVETVRLVNSGTEATMSAVRAARGFTGRPKVVKFEGCYHGHADFLLVKAGSGLATFGTPDSAGVPAEFAAHTLTLPYNDPDALNAAFDAAGGEIAAVIVEPFVGNMGVVLPAPGFVEALRTVPRAHGALLIADEVMTGFRVAWGGAQELLDLKPDLTCLGKVIGGGLPVGAYGGRADVMSKVSPLGPVYQAGTMSGNPISVAAGIATLSILGEFDPYPWLEGKAARLCGGLAAAARDAGVTVQVNRIASMFTVFFTDAPVTDWRSADRCDRKAYAAFFHEMRRRGVSLPPSQFEAAFLSTAHGDAEVDLVLGAAAESFRAVGAAFPTT